ncbi:MAG: leucyl aminopeptidase [Legionellaceae bacterium]|nr:leucyl aminopeptidase [Legionellaceae bacterium]
MRYELLNDLPNSENNPCCIIGICTDTPLPSLFTDLDTQYQGLLSKLYLQLKQKGDWIEQADCHGQTLVLIHCGSAPKFQRTEFRKCMQTIAALPQTKRLETLTLCLPRIANTSLEEQLEYTILDLDWSFYQYQAFKSKPTSLTTQCIRVYLPDASRLQETLSIAEAIRTTRVLADLPANVCTPHYMGEQALKLAQDYPSVSCQVLNKTEIEKLGMGALLAVAQGSQEPPVFITLEYTPAQAQNAQPIVLVGKGVTFDSGGLSIKPANFMDEMKYDMTGAASVLGIIQACAALQLPLHVIGLMPCTENLPGNHACKPGDIIKTMSGQTVEILNTDAEGRLILADALTYAERFNPECVIDIATLTGAVIVSLGNVHSGLMTSDDTLCQELVSAGKQVGDTVWRLPVEEAYNDALDSPLADMINAGFDRTAGSITAACFLAKFTQKYPHVHLDIAGTGWISGKQRKSTGRPIPLLIRWLRDKAHAR